jgi:hypothetical protein
MTSCQDANFVLLPFNLLNFPEKTFPEKLSLGQVPKGPLAQSAVVFN